MNRSPAVHRGPTALLEMIISGDDVEMRDTRGDWELLVDEALELASYDVVLRSGAAWIDDDEDEADDDPYCELGEGD